MASQPDAEALYKKANALLKKWASWHNPTILEDARQEMVLAALQGKDMRNALRLFMEKEKYIRDHSAEIPEGWL